MRVLLILVAIGAAAFFFLRRKDAEVQPGFVRVSPNTTTPPPDSLVDYVTSGQLGAFGEAARAERERLANEARQAEGNPRTVSIASPTRYKDEDADRAIGSVMPVGDGWATWDGQRWQETSKVEWRGEALNEQPAQPSVEAVVAGQVQDALSTIRNFFSGGSTVKRTASV